MLHSVYRNRQAVVLKYAKIGFILLLGIMLVIHQSPIKAYSAGGGLGAVYYVSVTGDDSNPGTLQAPWRTIQKAANTLNGGDTVFVRGGTYEEFVSITSSGSKPEGYITFQAYPGEKPVIDGSNLVISSGKNSLIHIRKANYIIIDGFELRSLKSYSSSQYPAGIRVQAGGSNIHILNNNVHHIQNLSADGNAHGIHIYGDTLLPLTAIQISGNEVHHLTLGSSESITVSGNVDGFSIERNIVHDNNNIGIDVAGHYGACSAPCVDQARNGVIADNLVFNIDSSINPAYGEGSNSAGGIYADGATNVQIERNHVYNSDFGIEIASENKSKMTSEITVANNFVHHNDGAGIIMGGSNASNGGASNNIIANNTLVLNDRLNQGFGEISIQENVVNNTISNNILFGRSAKPLLVKWNTSGSGNTIDYNLYFQQGGQSGNPWRWNGVAYTEWTVYQKATGFDAHSVFADPLFTNLANNLVTLTEKSPAIDGANGAVGAGRLDYYGVLRPYGGALDIGAAEFTASPAPIPTQSASELAAPSPNASPTPVPAPTSSAASSTPPNAVPTSVPGSGNMAVDGNFQDWVSIEELAMGDNHVKSLKAVVRDHNLYILVKGNLLHEKGQLYLNTDGNTKSGFQAPFWDGAGADYLLENGTLYSYNGKGGTDWSWTKLQSYKKTSSFVASSSVVEAAIPLVDLGIVGMVDVQIGYVWKDSHADKLPVSSELAKVANTQAPAPTVHPVLTGSIQIDGYAEDWSTYPYTSSGNSNPTGLKLHNDKENLYLLIEGSDLATKTQVYFLSGSGRADYKLSGWESGISNILMENGRLYQYTGKGSNWSWQSMSTLNTKTQYVVQKRAIEVSIPLSKLKIKAGAELKVGVLLHDNKSTQLPAKGQMAVYTVK
ncbi:choice-of-anchor Q domain-containing protein [Paenibacillus sp. PL2-23]|uniref:right-handed parallel beta-helix repeat-containing protein n=1 Tax=Paenibacillus sp. PL2-23 TaxID=2100729 RepID=UPI0030F4B766